MVPSPRGGTGIGSTQVPSELSKAHDTNVASTHVLWLLHWLLCICSCFCEHTIMHIHAKIIPLFLHVRFHRLTVWQTIRLSFHMNTVPPETKQFDEIES